MRTELNVPRDSERLARLGASSGRGWALRGGGCALLAALLTVGPLHAAPPERPLLSALALLQAQANQVVTGDHTVAAGESVEDIVVVGGDLRILGEVTGDAVVVGGNLIMEASGSVLGDAVVTGGEIVNRGGRIRGEMRMMGGAGSDVSGEVREAIAVGAAEAAREASREASAPTAWRHG